jgi:hypothetical protein
MSREPPRDDHPLGMTVHSMPSVEDLSPDTSSRTRGGRWKMFMVLLVCAAPVIASYFTYYVVRPDGRRNFGELIDPQRTLPDVVGKTLDGKPVNLKTLKNQWLLMSVSSGACNEACTQHLYLQRQLREGLGREKDRVDWVWLINDDVPVSEVMKLALKDATVLRVPPAELAKWLQPAAGAALADHLYVVDPIGNWMMRFPANIAASSAPNMKRDLERLLRASAFWDKEGR